MTDWCQLPSLVAPEVDITTTSSVGRCSNVSTMKTLVVRSSAHIWYRMIHYSDFTWASQFLNYTLANVYSIDCSANIKKCNSIITLLALCEWIPPMTGAKSPQGTGNAEGDSMCWIHISYQHPVGTFLSGWPVCRKSSVTPRGQVKWKRVKEHWRTQPMNLSQCHGLWRSFKPIS